MPHYKVATGGFLGSPILGFPSIYAYALYHRTTKFDMVTRGGGAYILGSATRRSSRERSSMAPQFRGLLAPAEFLFHSQHGPVMPRGIPKKVFRDCWIMILCRSRVPDALSGT